MMNPVEQAVLPLKVDAISRAEQYAKDVVENFRKELAANGNDLNVVAPYPRNDPWNYAARHLYQLGQALCKWRQATYSGHGPLLADVDSKMAAKFVKDHMDEAAAQYDAFVMKLNHKIGACDSAVIEGNHVWGESFLTVKKGDLVEVWKTKQISNVSKLGKWFPQWPSRKVKR